MTQGGGHGAPLPENEADRLASLRATRLLDTRVEPGFDELTALAADICNAPIALLSLVDADRQWFKSRQGIAACETPREQSFCAHAIPGEGLFEIGDASIDPRFANNPLVTGDPGIRFYAGAPVSAPDGLPIGTLCVIDSRPRALGAKQREQLQRLAKLCSDLVAERQARLEAEQDARAQKHLLDTLGDGVVACDREGRLSLFNRAAREWHGCDPMSIPQSEWANRFDLFEADGCTPLATRRIPLARALSGESVTGQEMCIHPKGEPPRWVVASGGPLLDAEGHLEGAQVVMHDITQRSADLAALENERKRLEMVLEGTRAGTWEWNVQTGEARFNARWAEMIGYSLDELAPVSIQTWLDFAHPDDLQDSNARLQAHFKGEAAQYDYVCRMRHRQGHWIWVHDRGRVMSWSPDGKPLWMAGTHLDVTEIKEAERTTERTLGELQSIVQGARDVAIIGTDTAGIIRLFSPGAEQLLGYRADELVGTHTPAHFHDPSEVLARGAELSAERGRQIGGFEVFVDAARRGETETRRWSYLRKDGGRRTVSLSVSAIRDGSGSLAGFVGIAIDLTELLAQTHARAESEDRFRSAFEALRASEAKLSELFRLSPVSILLNRLSDGQYIEANPEFFRLTGYDERALHQLSYWDLTPQEYEAQEQVQLVKLDTEGRYGPYEKEYLHADGHRIPVLLSGVRFEPPGAAEPMILSVVQDISERKRLERMKSEFVSTVSHELRTPLTSISGALDLLVGGALGQLPQPAMELLELAHRNARRLGALVGDLLDLEKLLAGKLSITRSVQDLQALMVDILGSLAPYAERFGVRARLGALPRISLNTDPQRFTQIMNNLVSNAIKFSPAGSEVEIEAGLIEGAVELRVLDRGCGVPEEFRPQLFQSFAQGDNSDGRRGEGTGLGLAISRELVVRLGGEIGYSPREAGGSCFWVRLPITSAAPPPGARADAARVLIVEDDPDVAVVLGMLISREGLEPIYATDLASARAQLESHDVQALTLDLGLGDESGEDLLAALRADPATADLPVLIVSGRPGSLGEHDPKTGRMAKPLNPVGLLAALKAITAKPPDSNPATILLVEDDPDDADFVRASLGSVATVLTASSLAEATGMLSARRFDLVILDLLLPDGDGRSLLPQVPQPSPPVLVLSRLALDPDATTAFAAVLAKSTTDAAKLERFVNLLLPRLGGVSSREHAGSGP